MIGALKSWIVNICTIVIFITAIEMILPNNNLKKYGKFILGLILITVMINPIIKLVDRDFNINKYAREAEVYLDSDEYKVDYEKYKDENINETLHTFKKNLEIKCREELRGEFPQNNYQVSVDVIYNKEENQFAIEAINIGVEDGGIKKIKEVKINAQSVNSDNEPDVEVREEKKIKKIISSKLGVSTKVINIFNINN